MSSPRKSSLFGPEGPDDGRRNTPEVRNKPSPKNEHPHAGAGKNRRNAPVLVRPGAETRGKYPIASPAPRQKQRMPNEPSPGNEHPQRRAQSGDWLEFRRFCETSLPLLKMARC